jgi:alpha-galactosidase
MLPRQCQIWVVLRAGESAHRTSYSLTAAFLGRLCLSGDFLKLTKAQHARAQAAVDLYQRVAPIIAGGRSRRFGPEIKAYRHPEGWQAVRRVGPKGRSMLVVAHTFARPGTKVLSVPLPGQGWRISEHFGSGRVRLARRETTLTWQPGGEFRGVVVRLSRR